MWAFGVARKILSDHRRSLIRRRKLSERLTNEAILSQNARPVQDDVWEAIGALPPLDREIIQLVHGDGFSLAGVSRILGRKPGTIRSMYPRARSKLRASLAPSEGDEKFAPIGNRETASDGRDSG